MLSANAIHAGYDSREVLTGIEVALSAGEVLVLIGPNGSGKSTLLRVLARVLRPFSGTLLLEGRPYEQYSPTEFARRVAYAPQETPTEMGFSVYELVMMGRHPHQKGFFGITRHDREVVEEALAFTGIAHLKERRLCQLSGGERQRVNLARALAQEGKYLLLDEPTAHLDLRHQVQLLANLRKRVETHGIGLLLVLHDLNRASEYADRIALMSEGRIVAVGTPAEVLQPALLEAVYHTPTLIRPNPLTGKPLVFALNPEGVPPIASDAPHAFVIAGGGSGAELYYALLEAGWRVSTGVLNLLDTDEEIARALGLPHITEQPFSAISEASFQRALELACSAQAVVVADVPFGYGNLRNLELALHAQQRGIPTYLLTTHPITERDFTDGRATQLWQSLLQSGAQEVKTLSELLERLG